MARKHEAAAYLLAGLSPSQIARQMGITTSSVLGYLFNQVGEGKIRRTDIVFSINREIRTAIEQSIKKELSMRPSAVQQRLERAGLSVDPVDLDVYLRLREARAELGDLYELLREIELHLHSLVKTTMIEEHGAQWWRLGISAEIRKDCAARREEDESPAEDPFSYTTLVQILKVFDAKWAILSKKLPPELAKRKDNFRSQLNRINKIRNAVMHPCKGLAIHDEDFSAVSDFYRVLTSESAKPELYSFADIETSPRVS